MCRTIKISFFLFQTWFFCFAVCRLGKEKSACWVTERLMGERCSMTNFLAVEHVLCEKLVWQLHLAALSPSSISNRFETVLLSWILKAFHIDFAVPKRTQWIPDRIHGHLEKLFESSSSSSFFSFKIGIMALILRTSSNGSDMQINFFPNVNFPPTTEEEKKNKSQRQSVWMKSRELHKLNLHKN